jgi:hypothetical protein
MYLGKRVHEMTTAVCFKCGKLKFGAFLPCEAGSALPQDEEEIAISLAITDHYFDLPTLKQIGASIADGKPPQLDEHTHAQMLTLIRGSDVVGELTRDALPRLDGADQPLPKPSRPWWKLW